MTDPRGEVLQPTAAQIEAFRKEHHIPDDGKLEPWAVEENMVLAFLCSLAASAPAPFPANARAVAEKCAELARLSKFSTLGDGDVERAIRIYAASLPEAPQPGFHIGEPEDHVDATLPQPATQRSLPDPDPLMAVAEGIGGTSALAPDNKPTEAIEQAIGVLRDIVRRAPGVRVFFDLDAFIMNELNSGLVAARKYEHHILSLQRIVEREESLRSETAPSGTAKVPEKQAMPQHWGADLESIIPTAPSLEDKP